MFLIYKNMSNKLGISIEQIVHLYEEGKTPIEIAELLGCTHSNIVRRLHKYGIKNTKDYARVRHNRKGRHAVDLSFFKDINTEEKAYFLGIMMSDGSVHKNGFYLKLKDEDIVVKFKSVLRSDSQIIHYEKPFYNYVLQIYSQEMAEDLIKLGCVPNKTKILQFPPIPKELYSHFIRGYMDGDGCIRVGKTRSTDYFDITSASYTFLLQLKEILTPYTSHIGISKEKKYDVWHLRCGGKQVKFLLDWIYKDGTVYMQRKFFKYQLLSPR